MDFIWGGDIDNSGSQQPSMVASSMPHEMRMHPALSDNHRFYTDNSRVIYYIRGKIFFRVIIFLYTCGPCPNLEGTKDVLCYKFRRPTIGQNCSARCTDKGGHRDAFSNHMLERTAQSTAFFERHAQPCRPRATKP